jgi:chemotaxis protein MotB
MGKDTAIGQLQRIVDHLEGLAGDAEKGSGAVTRPGAGSGIHGRRPGHAVGAIARRTGGGASGAGRALNVPIKPRRNKPPPVRKEQAALLSARAERLANGTGTAQSGLGRQPAGTGATRRGHRRAERVGSRRWTAPQKEAAGAGRGAGEIRQRVSSAACARCSPTIPTSRWWATASCFSRRCCFASGEATLSASGSGDLDKFAMVYQQLAARLPPDLPVIIEVQGHTDRAPIRGGRFPVQLGAVHRARAGQW